MFEKRSRLALLLLPPLLSAMPAVFAGESTHVFGPEFADELAAEFKILRCRQLTDDVARLQCYDQMVLRPLDSYPDPISSSGKTMPAPSYSPQPPLPNPANNSSQLVLPAPAIDRFGMENRVGSEDRVETIESRILGEFKGWEPKQKFTLENGQIWQVSDGSSAYFHASDPKVWVERGAFGSFYLRFDGLNKKPKVKRLK